MLDIGFAASGDVNVAYHVVGDGPVDIVYVQGAWSHLEVQWELPAYRRFCERLGEFARVIRFDKRGMGMSDRVPGATSLEIRMDDIRAVMNAVGSESAALIGESEGGPLSLLFAAAHPERITGLILMGAEVRERTDEDWPWGEATQEAFDASMAALPEKWAKPGRFMEYLAPSQKVTPHLRDWMARLQRNANTPAGIEGFMRMAFEIDVRDIVPSIRVPTLVLHTEGDLICHVENARFLAREIPGARYVESPGADHVPWFEPDLVLGEIREFLTGHRVALTPDRVLATVLFTDIVGSTDRAAELGDGRWRELLDMHNTVLRTQLERFRGVEVNTAGDGFLATFDGPARAIQCAKDIQHQVTALGLEVRAGVHTGEIERLGDDVAGIAVHIGARIAGLAGANEVLVSRTVKDLVAGSGIEFEDRGEHTLKGVPDDWQVYAAI
ncbi:MAG: adenylate/guanylate cyclase domain-containing protein [Acidimicrobiia bacterium]|nr:adenylate/guanylate cyclase domain-containing protein [Acidimicrobiia bacterium]MBT8192881.1 adenylate/guanylate cyclase domain-containing protein [Acidimicrobiia bacterium]MBT8246217.1 adenylate/guanylate cyclase domain-containing protein [Acidimicrobiia bacterium]NNF87210.1 adenylate/guanylate cyclase domain-containing protein [Acidimicrobiia bacterium]NNJ46977.1 adenylate/guanylate cyclase domain-containing protein [Acidimicrobiia bacterium]